MDSVDHVAQGRIQTKNLTRNESGKKTNGIEEEKEEEEL